jgi:trehalose 6-phosphate phosphatase
VGGGHRGAAAGAGRLMDHLFTAWKKLEEACRAADRVLMLADYDGTLTPIVSRPEEAVLSDEMRDRLILVASVPKITVGVISGRELMDVEGLVAIGGLYYAGNHGLEMDGPGYSYVNAEADKAKPIFHKLAGRLTEAFSGIEGIVLQDKELSLSVHYRLVAKGQESEVERIVRELTGPLVAEGRVRVFGGKKVWEVRPPVDWNKGSAVAVLRSEVAREYAASSVLTIFLGDDVTDEDAFKVVVPPDGWSVYVGEPAPASAAAYHLESPAEVAELLERLARLA